VDEHLMLEVIAKEAWRWGSAQIVVMLIGCVAAACALFLSSRANQKGANWLARIGLTAPFLALAMTMLGLAEMHQQVLELEGFLPSTSPPVPLDQKIYARMRLVSEAPVVLGQLAALMLPVVTWVWIRVNRPGFEHRRLRMLAVAAAGVLSIALWAASRWANEYIFRHASECGGSCRTYGFPAVDLLFESLEQLRALIVLAGVSLGVAAVGFAVVQARRGLRLRKPEWMALLGLLGVAAMAKLWTADERSDTRAYIRWEGNRHAGFGRDPDLMVGPTLEHCKYDWTGSDLVLIGANPEYDDVESWVRGIERCDGPDGNIAILADPTVEITRIAVVLQTFKAKHWRRVGVASLRPELESRATTGEFIRHRSCVVELELSVSGVPLTRFSTWAELAAAADAAEGTLVINPAL
jgi:hypothetical protein